MVTKPTFRASEVDRILACPASMQLVPLVAEREGDEGYEGTMLHWAIADRLIREQGAVCKGGLLPPDVPAGFKLKANVLWIIEWAVWLVKREIPDDWTLLVEQSWAYSFDQFNLSGHGDVWGMSPDGKRCKGIDWKTGRKPADSAERSWQALSYLVLGKRAWPALAEGEFIVAQPWVNEETDGVEQVSRAKVDATDFDDLGESLEGLVNAAIADKWTLNDGINQCRWCPVGIQCPALQAKRELMKMTLTPQALAEMKEKPDDGQLGDWVVDTKTLAGATEKADDMLHARLDENQVVHAACGVAITRKIQKGRWSVVQPMELFKAVSGTLDLPRVVECITYSTDRLKDQVALQLGCPKTGKEAITAASVFDANFAPYMEQGERRLLVFT